jgi:hypothetical protein
MTRRLYTLANAFSLLLFAATVTLWLTSLHTRTFARAGWSVESGDVCFRYRCLNVGPHGIEVAWGERRYRYPLPMGRLSPDELARSPLPEPRTDRCHFEHDRTMSWSRALDDVQFGDRESSIAVTVVALAVACGAGGAVPVWRPRVRVAQAKTQGQVRCGGVLPHLQV